MLVAVSLSGCAGSQDEAATHAAVGLLDAAAQRDGVAACGFLATPTRDELEQSSGTPCEQAVLEEDLGAGDGAGDDHSETRECNDTGSDQRRQQGADCAAHGPAQLAALFHLPAKLGVDVAILGEIAPARFIRHQHVDVPGTVASSRDDPVGALEALAVVEHAGDHARIAPC